MDFLTQFQSAASEGMDGFFGSVQSAGGDFMDVMANKVLPNWAANQLGMQQTDQLAQPTYYQPTENRTVDNAMLDTYNKPIVQFSPSSVLMIGMVAIIGLFVIKKVM